MRMVGRLANADIGRVNIALAFAIGPAGHLTRLDLLGASDAHLQGRHGITPGLCRIIKLSQRSTINNGGAVVGVGGHSADGWRSMNWRQPFPLHSQSPQKWQVCPRKTVSLRCTPKFGLHP
jgi:hypothetical protein